MNMDFKLLLLIILLLESVATSVESVATSAATRFSEENENVSTNPDNMENHGTYDR